ncbi:uncharacterized protein K489DRAFT_376958 [Dissoconium aciculare CBS 342.82]|uniref:Uncharacterized protein n=1 Tax=Dissoconium aciculare CBS 342.82 TaxID=1314786 RepID=A0A6J3MEV9_9PEZI|nr:uncharacterized protein K489DRAFT_376958 [Dissoconium aciculare CBS 342.82]KAF1826535.1 hypothetical protein K489DRAFT_376958 [Dissoconium aciculare CBS 342.82]
MQEHAPSFHGAAILGAFLVSLWGKVPTNGFWCCHGSTGDSLTVECTRKIFQTLSKPQEAILDHLVDRPLAPGLVRRKLSRILCREEKLK